MGEIPVERVAKPSAGWRLLGWLALAAVLVAAALQFGPVAMKHLPALRTLAPEMTAQTPATAPRDAPAATGSQTLALPNPVAGQASGEGGAAPAASAPQTQAAQQPTAAASPAPVAPPSPPETAAVTTAAASPAPAATTAANALPEAGSVEVPLVLTFKGTSWAEVKDARGRVVLQMMGGAGMKQTVTAVAPLELALGNAPEVDVTFRGQALDLAPYTRGNVARVALK